jgi:hypothetical protein
MSRGEGSAPDRGCRPHPRGHKNRLCGSHRRPRIARGRGDKVRRGCTGAAILGPCSTRGRGSSSSSRVSKGRRCLDHSAGPLLSTAPAANIWVLRPQGQPPSARIVAAVSLQPVLATGVSTSADPPHCFRPATWTILLPVWRGPQGGAALRAGPLARGVLPCGCATRL